MPETTTFSFLDGQSARIHVKGAPRRYQKEQHGRKYDRFQIPIVDLETGEEKVFDAPKSVAYEISRHMVECTAEPPRSRWVRFLEFLRLKARPPMLYPTQFQITRMTKRFAEDLVLPTYEVTPLGGPWDRVPLR